MRSFRRFFAVTIFGFCLATTTPAAGGDPLWVTFDILEAHCGPEGLPLERCEELDLLLRDPLTLTVEDMLREVNKRYVMPMPSRIGQRLTIDNDLHGANITLTYETSKIDDARIHIDVSYKIDMPFGQSRAGESQAVLTLGEEGVPAIGGSTHINTGDDAPPKQVVRLIFLSAKAR
ncbi:MAG: hypothetical protein AAFY29_05410 [Pseudomonadota bacterium]